MSEDKNEVKTWNGLNNPALDQEEADVLVLGLPFDGAASYRRGAAEGPDRIRSISGHIEPTTEDGRLMNMIKVLDLGNIEPAGLNQAEYFTLVENQATGMFKKGFSTFIGGDHSVTIPLLNAAAGVWGDSLGVIHLDAHLDLCHELGGNMLSHGSTHRRVLEKNNLPLEQVWFVGIRSFEQQELEFLSGKKANIITATEMDNIGVDKTAEQVSAGLKNCSAVYLTLDIDFLDPSYAPGTGTPKPGGFSTRTLLSLLERLSSLPMIGMDVVEVSPPLDHSDITSFAAQRAITETWGRLFIKD
ncbi:MAG: agmatinase [Bacillota bacterium]|nr:agmatinase [Bacillota bacterium]